MAIATGIALTLTLAVPSRTPATNALLIELDSCPGILASAISANNLVVGGGFSGGGAFYWAPIQGRSTTVASSRRA
jgi:hypothetical protein